MTSTNLLVDFRGAEALDVPFPHLVMPRCLDGQLGSDLLAWFQCAPWEFRSIEGFYETHDIDMRTVELPAELEVLRSPELTLLLREHMERWTGLAFEPRLDIHAQKLRPGYRIGIHSDFGPVRQTHRLLFQVNSGWGLGNGGLLMLFDSEQPEEDSPSSRYYLPRHLSAVAFEISPRSHHAVSEILASDRYTLAYSFYCVDGYRRFGFEPGTEPFTREA
jgi:hypothetical protein